VLKYKVLWIDDNVEAAKVKAEGIREFLEDEGFMFETIFRENEEHINHFLDDPELDIIITDFNLETDVEGLINIIRQRLKYMDLILYSENPPQNFQDVLNKFEGIYGCIREDVEDTIKSVIQNTIRRTQNVSNMRGIVISEGIDIENQVEEIIIKYFGDKGELAKKVLEKEGVCDFGKKIAFLNSILKTIVKDYNKKINDEKDPAVRDNLGTRKTKIQSLYDISKKLSDEVMKPRNVLAHVEQGMGTDNVPYLRSLQKGYEDINADAEWYKKTRKDLQKHSENLTFILKFISEN
jgi:hypothetical protein